MQSAWRVHVGAGLHQNLARVGVGWVTPLVGGRIDCCHTHTGLEKVTDAGLKAFSATLGSSTTITTVNLQCKYKWLVKLL